MKGKEIHETADAPLWTYGVAVMVGVDGIPYLAMNGTRLDPKTGGMGPREVAARFRSVADAIDKAAGVLESEGHLVPLSK